jgi:hypothetical protein
MLCPIDDGPYLGTAFSVSKYLVVCAFHSIGDRKTCKVIHDNVKLRWLGGDLMSRAKYAAGDCPLDYALYELQPPLPTGYDLQPLGIAEHPPAGEGFRSAGFPQALQGSVVMPSVQGSVTGYDARLQGDVPAIQLYCEESATQLSLRGFSGAPVIVGDDLALGVIRWNPPLPENPEYGQGGLVYATSMSMILQKRPLFFRDVKVYTPSQWFGKTRWF